MNFWKKHKLKKNKCFLLNSTFLCLIFSLNVIKCDLIIRTPKDLQSQFKGKKIIKKSNYI